MKKKNCRYEVLIEGKHQGGSFATKKEAETIGDRSGKKFEVREKPQGLKPAPELAEPKSEKR